MRAAAPRGEVDPDPEGDTAQAPPLEAAHSRPAMIPQAPPPCQRDANVVRGNPPDLALSATPLQIWASGNPERGLGQQPIDARLLLIYVYDQLLARGTPPTSSEIAAYFDTT